MSTAVSTPAIVKTKKKKKDKVERPPVSAEDSAKADAFSEMLLATVQTQPDRTPAKKQKDPLKKKKRPREEVESTATSATQREESPAKRQKSNDSTLQPSPEKSTKHKKNKLVNGDHSATTAGAQRQPSPAAESEAELAQPAISPERQQGKKSRKDKVTNGNISAVTPTKTWPPKTTQDVPLSSASKLPTRTAAKESQHIVSNDPAESPFVSVVASFKVTVPPVAQLYPLQGALAQYVSPLLLTWHTQLNGILLAYNNARLHSHAPDDPNALEESPLAHAVDECAAPYVWLTLDALVFRPKKGRQMEGYVNLQNESHITLILWNFFTVTINYKHLPRGWTWHEAYQEQDTTMGYDEDDRPMQRHQGQWGSWHDSDGSEVQGFLPFRITNWDCAPPSSSGEGSFLSIEGSMLTEQEEEALKRDEEAEAARAREAAALQRARIPRASALRKGSTPVPSSPLTAASAARAR